jgi:hypothetical protein
MRQVEPAQGDGQAGFEVTWLICQISPSNKTIKPARWQRDTKPEKVLNLRNGVMGDKYVIGVLTKKSPEAGVSTPEVQPAPGTQADKAENHRHPGRFMIDAIVTKTPFRVDQPDFIATWH